MVAVVERAVDVTDLTEAAAFRPPAPTIVTVPAANAPPEDGAVRGYLVIGRLGLDHTLAYLFLGGSPALERVEAIVRRQPEAFPGDTVVIDLGESYGSFAEAERRAAAMRCHLPDACRFIVGAFDDDQPTRA